MARQKISKLVEEIALPVIQEEGMELVEVGFVKEGGRWYLRIFIDKPGGVGLEDCRKISEAVDKLLDEKDPVPHAYTLEVSSPGVQRPLKKPADYDRFAGRLVKITTFAPFNGRKKFTGRIVGMRGDDVLLEMDGMDYPIPFVRISSARLEVEF